MTENIEQVEAQIENTEERMSAGEEWLDAQLVTLKRHLKVLYQKLAEVAQPELVG